MMRLLQHLREFLKDEEALKYLPGNFTIENCILLTQHKKDSTDGIFRTYLQVFDHSGNWIGEVKEPEFIPFSK